jgi:hypothetical protein
MYEFFLLLKFFFQNRRIFNMSSNTNQSDWAGFNPDCNQSQCFDPKSDPDYLIAMFLPGNRRGLYLIAML